MTRENLLPDPSDELWFPKIDIGEKVDTMKCFIAEAIKRLDTDGFLDEDGEHQVSLLVDNGRVSIFDRLNYPGSLKIWVSLTYIKEKILFRFCPIGDREQTVGGDVPIHLPRLPEDLDELTLPIWDPHWNHTGTVEDWNEMTRWVQEGKVNTDSLYLKRALFRTYGVELQT